MRACFILLQLLFLFISSASFAQQQIAFEHLSDKDGLVNNSVTSIIKDSYGYMWFGTYHGVSRYDGYNFSHYLDDPEEITSYVQNRVRCMLETSDKTFMIALELSGFSIFDRKTETFKNFRHHPKNKNSLSDDYVLTMYQDKRGNVWIGTRAGFDKFDLKTQTFLHYAPPEEKDYFVSAITEDEKGNLWLYGRGNHVYKFNPEDNTFQNFIFNTEEKSNFWLGGVIEYDRHGNLWIGTEGNGLFRFNPQTGKKDWYSVENQILKYNIVYSVIEDAEGKIWIGTDGGGVTIYDYKANSFQTFINDSDNPSSLNANGVYCIYESDPGVIWVGVFGAGLNIHKKYKKKFLKFSGTGKPEYRLSCKSVIDMAEAEDGKIWLGTDGGGLNLFDPITYKFTHYTPNNSINPLDKVISVYQDKEKNLWLGSYGKDLCRINLDQGTVKRYPANIHAQGETILGNNVWFITESFDEKIWLGLLNFGINIYDPIKDKFDYHPFDTAAFKQAIATIYVLFEDSKKRMWIGSESSGAGYYDPETKKFIRFRTQKKPGAINSDHIRDIYEDSQGNIWIATFKGGINKLVDIEKGEFISYTTKDGLPSNNILKILEDDHHNLWLSSDKGISMFKVAEKKFVNFDMEDGLQSIGFNWNSSLKTRNGYMYFGGPEGFNIFHPDSIRFNTTPPAVVISDFKIFNNSILPGKDYNGRRPLKKAIGMAEEITLTHQDYIFSIEFSALDFISPQKNKYAYRLKGFNDRWTYVNADKRFAIYTNLDPGEYTFEVIACNNDDVWNMKGTSLRIIVLPPWWMTWWFRTLMVLLLTAILVGFYYLRLRSIQQRNKYLQEEVTKRTAEIMMQKAEITEQKNKLEYLNKTKDKFFSIIGHDLKGPVKAITALASLLKEESDFMINEKQKTLSNHLFEASNKVQKLVISLLEWARTQSQEVKTKPENIYISKLLKENIELLSEQAAQKYIQIELDTLEEHVVYADYNMINTIVRNVLSNSIKYTSRGGRIKLSSSITDPGHIQLSVADNGIGMSAEILNKLFTLERKGSVKGTDNELGTGLGLIIAKEFAELNHGKIYAESIVGKGSTFFLVLPGVVAEHANSL